MKKFINLLLCIGFMFTISCPIISAEDDTQHKNIAKAELTNLFSLYDDFYYSDENWQIMQ